jgi:hypothetical protein
MDARRHLDEMSRGFMHSAILLTACELELFEAMGDGAHTAADLAGPLGLDTRALETVLLALAADWFVLKEGERFRLNPEFAPYLLPDSPRTMIHILTHNYHIMQRWVRLGEVLQTGKPIPRDPNDESQMRAFICGMADISRSSSREVAEKFDFSPYRRLLDLGGGPGTAAITFAQKYPNLSCVVFDLPGPLAIAHEQIEAAKLAGRVATQAGDYYTDELGTGFDIVYISNIIHSMGDEETAMLIEKSKRALAPGGTIIIKEFFLEDDRIHPEHAALFSVNMLVGTEHGKSYTLGAWSSTRSVLAIG